MRGKKDGNRTLLTINPRYRHNTMKGLILVGVKSVARSRFLSLLSVPREHNLTKTPIKKTQCLLVLTQFPLEVFLLFLASDHLDFLLIIPENLHSTHIY